jgi:hypothetical protein
MTNLELTATRYHHNNIISQMGLRITHKHPVTVPRSSMMHHATGMPSLALGVLNMPTTVMSPLATAALAVNLLRSIHHITHRDIQIRDL